MLMLPLVFPACGCYSCHRRHQKGWSRPCPEGSYPPVDHAQAPPVSCGY